MAKVDAKIELIRTLFAHEMQRLVDTPVAGEGETRSRLLAGRNARIEALRWAVKQIDEVTERTR